MGLVSTRLRIMARISAAALSSTNTMVSRDRTCPRESIMPWIRLTYSRMPIGPRGPIISWAP